MGVSEPQRYVGRKSQRQGSGWLQRSLSRYKHANDYPLVQIAPLQKIHRAVHPAC